MDLQQVARGLWRWALTHPEWEPPEQEDSPADWPAEVGCVAYETRNTFVCPESWLRHLGGYTQEDLRAGLQPLLDLPVEMVLVSHGEPVLRDGHAALERALA